MSIAELMQQGTDFLQVGLLCMSVYLTVITGYLIVAYSVGRQLSRFQLWTVTFLFLAFATILTLACLASLRSAIAMFLAVQTGAADSSVFTLLSHSAYVAPAIQLLGIAMSISFMRNIRRTRVAAGAPVDDDGDASGKPL